MKLDTKVFRYLTQDDWRVLTAVEMGSKNHEVVPTPLIVQLAGLRTGSNTVNKCISTLAKADLIARVRNVKYDGYRLTYGGSDYLALHSHTKADNILRLGSQMGVGKESDIYLVTAPGLRPSEMEDNRFLSENTSGPKNTAKQVQSILKIHRLGRTSFRSLARNRAYHRHRQHCSWQYLSRLSAQKEFAAMRALHRAGFPVPRPIAWNRHTIVMSLVPGLPLKDVPLSAFSPKAAKISINEEQQADNKQQEDEQGEAATQRDENIASLYAACIELALQLASHGLIHGDLNEFNILIEHVPGAFDSPSTPDSPTKPDIPHTLSPTNDPAAQIDTPVEPLTRPPSNHKSQHIQKPMKPHLIDFPQITSLSHPSAEDFFARDIAGIKTFFRKRYHFESEDNGPTFADAMARLRDAEAGRTMAASARLDVEIEAAGFSKKMARELEVYFAETGDGDDEDDGDGDIKEEEEPRDEDKYENSHDVSLGLSNQLDPAEALPKVSLDSKEDFAEVTMDKLASLSLQNTHTSQSRKTKATAGWSI